MITRKNPAPSRLEQHTKGFTLTEIAIVLGIMGLILGAIWVAAASVYNSQRVNMANTAVAQIAQNIRTLYASSSSTGTTGDITTAMAYAKAIPSNLLGASATANLVGPFPGGTTKVFSASDSNGFVISMNNIPQAACISLVTSVAGTGRDPGLYKATVDSANGAPSSITPGTTALPMVDPILPTAAQTSCSGANNNVTFGFSLK